MSATASAIASEQHNLDTVQLQEMQDTVSRLSSHKNVRAVMILNKHGDILVGTTNNNNNSATAASHTTYLLDAANKYIRALQPDDEVVLMQVRSKNNQELMIAPHGGYVLAVLKCTSI
jgi:dynein light chain roadblock-type